MDFTQWLSNTDQSRSGLVFQVLSGIRALVDLGHDPAFTAHMSNSQGKTSSR